MTNLTHSLVSYRTIRDRIIALEAGIDEETLADTLEGLTDLHEVVAAVVRSALVDEALSKGLKGHIEVLQERLERLSDRAKKRREIARDAMIEVDIRKVDGPRLHGVGEIRVAGPGGDRRGLHPLPLLAAARSTPRSLRTSQRSQERDDRHRGRALKPGTGAQREGQVMGFSDKQARALTRGVPRRAIRSRLRAGRELSYIEGWYVVSQANRIFGFDGWDRETVETKCIMAREARGTVTAIYSARVRITVRTGDAVIIRDGHGTGEAHGDSAGEVHDRALKAAETDATKRALATSARRSDWNSMPAGAPPDPWHERNPQRRLRKCSRDHRPKIGTRAFPQDRSTAPDQCRQSSGKHPYQRITRTRVSQNAGLRQKRQTPPKSDRSEQNDHREAGDPSHRDKTEDGPVASPLANGAMTSGRIEKAALAFPEPHRVRDKDHLRFVAAQPCLLCSATPSDAHHLRFAQPRAMSRKVGDDFTVPLCRAHHRTLHHSGNESAFWHDLGIDPLEIARDLWEQTEQRRERFGVEA